MGILERCALAQMPVSLTMMAHGPACPMSPLQSWCTQQAAGTELQLLSPLTEWHAAYVTAGAAALQREARFGAVREWALLQAFCAQHRLPCDSSHLTRLAARNDWIFFLAEASTHTVPLEQVPDLSPQPTCMGCPYVAARSDWISFLANALSHLLPPRAGSVTLLLFHPLEAFHAHV